MYWEKGKRSEKESGEICKDYILDEIAKKYEEK